MKSIGCLIRLSVFIVSLALAGCAASAPQVKQRFFWPMAPEQPRLEWLGTYSSNLDLTQKGGGALAFLVGEEESDHIINPSGIAADGEGRVFVSDLARKSVMVFNFNTKEVHSLGGVAAIDFFKNPSGIDFDADGNIYVADLDTRHIHVFDKLEKPLRSLDLADSVASIGFIAIDRQRKRIIIPDVRGHKIVIMDYAGKPVRTIKLFREKGGGFSFPNAVALDSKGNIIVADSMNARIVRLTPEGDFLSVFGQRGDILGDIAMVKGVAVDSEDHIYITDMKANRLQIYDEKGQPLLAIGQQTSNPKLVGGFHGPIGIYIDKNDSIYITDKFGRRFQIYQYLNSRYMAQHPIRSDVEIAKPLEVKDSDDAKGKKRPSTLKK